MSKTIHGSFSQLFLVPEFRLHRSVVVFTNLLGSHQGRVVHKSLVSPLLGVHGGHQIARADAKGTHRLRATLRGYYPRSCRHPGAIVDREEQKKCVFELELTHEKNVSKLMQQHDT